MLETHNPQWAAEVEAFGQHIRNRGVEPNNVHLFLQGHMSLLHICINEFIEEEKRPVQFRHMIYFGDGTTDIPCMKLVKQQGGHSIAVYNPRSRQKRQTMEQLIRDNRVSYICAADYSPDKEIDTLVRTIIDKIHADDRLSKFYRKTEP